MAYEFDFFLSYPGNGTAGKWTNAYFQPTLIEAFQDEIGITPNIYNFVGRDVGIDWPEEVKNALHRSKYLIAILTPPYFTQSTWCPAEWETMAQRERLVTFPAGHEDRRLIVPVLFSDGDHFPDYVGDIRRVNMREFAFPEASFGASEKFMPFREEMRKLARQLGPALDVAPQWQGTWPKLRRPPAAPVARFSKPRL